MNGTRHFMVILSLMSCFTYAQEISRQVISSQGSYDSNQIMSLEWTLGDAFVETVSTKNRIFTQGFNQPFLLRSEEVTEDKINLIVFPNPVNSSLNILVHPNYGDQIKMTLHDIHGRFIKESNQQVKNLSLKLDVSYLQSGIYILNIYNEDTTLVDTHKIVKY